MANGLFKGNATYFGRKSGTLEDIVAKINEAPSKPEVFDMKSESEAYKKVFNAAMKKFGVNSPADFKSDEEKKKFFDYVDKNYKGKDEAHEKSAEMNKKQLDKKGEEMPTVKKSVKETVRDMLMKAWRNAAELAEKNKVSEGELPPALQKHIDKKKKDKVVKEEVLDESMSKVTKKRASNGDIEVFYRGRTKYGVNKQIGYYHKEGSYLSVYHDNEDDKDDFTQNDQARNERDAIKMIYDTAKSNKVIREQKDK